MATAAATSLMLEQLFFATAAAAAGAGVSRAISGGAPKVSAPQPLPQPPSPEAAADKAAGVIRKKRVAMTQSIYTSPLGLAGEAQVARKTLLGQ